MSFWSCWSPGGLLVVVVLVAMLAGGGLLIIFRCSLGGVLVGLFVVACWSPGVVVASSWSPVRCGHGRRGVCMHVFVRAFVLHVHHTLYSLYLGNLSRGLCELQTTLVFLPSSVNPNARDSVSDWGNDVET